MKRNLSVFMRKRHAVIVLTTIAAGLCLSSPSAGSAQTASGRLDSRLTAIVDAFDGAGPTAAAAEAQRLGVRLDGQRVRVIAEVEGASAAGAVASAADASVERGHGDLVQLTLPLATLRAFATTPGVRLVRPPLRPQALVEGEGVALIDADDWHTAGVTGAGVKLAVLDLGFAGYEALLGTELPPSVTAQSFRADGDITGGGIDHGTIVAEIAHEVAPDASLYLLNFDTEVELAAASDWMALQGVQVVNASWGYFTSGPGDGTGIVDDIVTTSLNDGTFWAAAAGNHAARHWSGTFTDSDADLFHEFLADPQDEGNQVIGAFFGLLSPGETVTAELRWNDPYGAACRDYDLFLMDVEGQSLIEVAASENVQNDGSGCVAGADPVESFSHVVAEYDTYHLVIKKSVAPTDASFDLFVGAQGLEYAVSAGSLLQPADHPAVATVGAVYWNTPSTLEEFSSRGPNSAGVIKPDVVAPDGVSTSGGLFFGTSGAAPHLAGAAALALQLMPCLSPPALRAYLESGAIDLGAAGKDSDFGSGRLTLGSAPPDIDGDGIGDACDDDKDGDGCANVEELAGEHLYGGQRDPAIPWDFYDVNGTRKVDAADIGLVRSKFNQDFPPYDRSAGAAPWAPGPPDGIVNAVDVGLVRSSFNNSCQAPP